MVCGNSDKVLKLKHADEEFIALTTRKLDSRRANFYNFFFKCWGEETFSIILKLHSFSILHLGNESLIS